jgi:predicted dinucleotide-binding enzyme
MATIRLIDWTNDAALPTLRCIGPAAGPLNSKEIHMKVAILGTGTVGQHLAKGFVGLGHEVIFGTRNPDGESARKALAAVGPGVRAATFADAAKAADFAVLATSWEGTESAVKLAGAANLAGKLVIDAINPLAVGAGGPTLAVGHSTSAAELIQGWLPQAKVVKAFNIVTATHMVNPQLAGGPPTMFIAGNDAAAKQQVLGILKDFGWESIDIGALDGARLLEPLAMLWIRYAFQNNHWTHAFKLLGRA